MTKLCEYRRSAAHPDLTILRPGGQEFTVWAKGDASDIQVTSLSRRVIHQ